MNKKGFTLVELMISIVIMAIITAGLWRITKGGTQSLLRAQRQAEVINSGERAMRGFGAKRGIIKDIRRASSVKSLNAGSLSLGGPDINYFLSPGTNNLVQAVAGSTTTVAGNVTALSFKYYKIQNGLLSLATAAVLVDSIEVGISVAKGGAACNLTSSARLRNK